MFKRHLAFILSFFLLIVSSLLVAGSLVSHQSAPTLSSPNTQASEVTPIGAQATCLTIHSPALVKLADGNYELVDEIDNCGRKDAGPLQITTQINTQATKRSTNLMGPATIPANGKAMYHTFEGQAGGKNKEIHFPSPPSPSALVTVSVTINGAIQGEWDGQVQIPA